MSEEIVKAEEEESKMDKFDEGDKLKNEKKANRIGNKNAFDDESEEEPTIGCNKYLLSRWREWFVERAKELNSSTEWEVHEGLEEKNWRT